MRVMKGMARMAMGWRRNTFSSMMSFSILCFCCDGDMSRSVLAVNILNIIVDKREIPIVCEARSAYSNTQGIEILQQAVFFYKLMSYVELKYRERYLKRKRWKYGEPNE